ncbi:hypothetical protein [Deinococcus alpinitundrae]|uniref:hypothetical protein n=1 Tax=Deinococcus alpinitundrae TaxID=468913 RepID=UPI00137A86CF|nr:hypothetical protein [Deinococcus alpinitundrae]
MRKSDLLKTLVTTILIPILNLAFTTIYIPNILSVGAFAEWRLASSVIAFAGILHFGTADGIYRLWLSNKTGKVEVSVVTINLVLVMVILSSIIVSWMSFRYLGLGISSLLALAFSLALACLFSFSTYYAQVFFNGNRLRLALSSQSLLFFLFVSLLGIYKLESVSLVILSYGLATTPALFLMIFSRSFVIVVDRSVSEAYNILTLGAPLMTINVLIILFINLDKFYAKIQLGNSITFAEYAVRSSLFVASCGLGMALGSLLVSKRIHLVKMKIRFIILIITLVLAIAFAGKISIILNLLIRKYDVDYTGITVASAGAFVFFLTYVSYGRIHMISASRAIFLTFPFFYITAVYLQLKFNVSNFSNSSIFALSVFIGISIILYEFISYKLRRGVGHV